MKVQWTKIVAAVAALFGCSAWELDAEDGCSRRNALLFDLGWSDRDWEDEHEDRYPRGYRDRGFPGDGFRCLRRVELRTYPRFCRIHPCDAGWFVRQRGYWYPRIEVRDRRLDRYAEKPEKDGVRVCFETFSCAPRVRGCGQEWLLDRRIVFVRD